jgi:Spy/CpxP family protein refolding chaperone
MMPSLQHLTLAVFFALMVSNAATAQPFLWWKTDPAKTELALTSEQSTEIEGVFQDAIKQLRQQKDDLDRLESKLSHLIEANADEAQVGRQIDRVETVRSSLNKTRTLMLLHMRQVLTADQRLKLNTMHDRWEQQQRPRDKDKPPAAPETGARPDGGRQRPN